MILAGAVFVPSSSTTPRLIRSIAGSGGNAFHFRFVNLFDAIARGRDEIGEIAIIRQQQETFGIEVETADRMKPAKRRRQEFGYQRSALRIGDARQITLRLIQQHVDFFALREDGIDQLAANLDVIPFGDPPWFPVPLRPCHLP